MWRREDVGSGKEGTRDAEFVRQRIDEGGGSVGHARCSAIDYECRNQHHPPAGEWSAQALDSRLQGVGQIRHISGPVADRSLARIIGRNERQRKVGFSPADR